MNKLANWHGCNHRLSKAQLARLKKLRDTHGNAKFVPTKQERSQLSALIEQDFIRVSEDGKVHVAREAFGAPPYRAPSKIKRRSL